MKRIGELDLGLQISSEDPKESLRMAVESMTNSKQQPTLENWVLFNFCEMYNRDRPQRLEWVERGEPPAPDFLVFTRPNATPVPLEITELLDPDRKRREEYKSAWEQAERTGDYLAASDVPEPSLGYDRGLIGQARQVLARKFGKPYPHGTWLVVYFNPRLFSAFQEDSLRFAVRIVQSALDSLKPPERIAQVWVLTNDLRISQLRIIGRA